MKLEEQMRRAIRMRHLALRTEDAYVGWYRRFVLWHGKRHPAEMREPEVEAFLSYLANERKVSASSQNQAFSALLFLYEHVIRQPLGRMNAARAKRKVRLPCVLTREEVRRVLDCAKGEPALILAMLYGTGGRLMEGLRLRLKDVDFTQRTIAFHDTKHDGARVVMLPEALREPLAAQIERAKAFAAQDRRENVPGVMLPDNLAAKYPKAGTLECWQWVFPSDRLSQCPRTGIWRRHHFHETVLQRAMARAVRLSAVCKPAHIHTLRHSCSTHLLEAGYNIREIQQLLGHKDVATTMLYTRVMQPTATAIRSPLDADSSKVVPFHAPELRAAI